VIPLKPVDEAHVYFLRRLSGMGSAPYVTTNPTELDAIAHLWVDGMIDAHLPPPNPNGWKGTAAVLRVTQRGLDFLRRRELQEHRPYII
jgi:hypothetical protein